MLLSIQLPINAQESDIKYYSVYKSIRLKGETDPTAGNKFVTAILKDGNGVLNMAEIEIDSAGRYDYVFNTPSITEEVELVVKCADEDITNTVYEAILQMNLLDHSFFVFKDEGGEMHVVYKRKDSGYGLIEAR